MDKGNNWQFSSLPKDYKKSYDFYTGRFMTYEHPWRKRFQGLCDQKVHVNVSNFGWLQNYYPLETMNTGVRIIENKWSKIINKHNT
jgi:hypothetical protein